MSQANPQHPYHAVSRLDEDGAAPIDHITAEEDCGSLAEAREWLAKRGGGDIEQFAEGRWRFVETVDPQFETAMTA